jgi:hypothetical protein
MSVQEYSARRHYLNSLTAKLGGHTPAEWAKLLSNSARPRASRPIAGKPVAKPAASPITTVAQRRLRLAKAETGMRPAPKARPLRPVAPEACSSWGSAFDLAPVCYAVDGASARATGAATRLNVQATHNQRLRRLARAEADMRR